MPTTQTTNTAPFTVHITANEKGLPTGKLADVEIHFGDGNAFAGLKLIGFAVWQRRNSTQLNVTFPARTYSVNGERRSFSLLRPVGGDPHGQDAIRNAILEAYAAFEVEAANAN